MRCCVLDLNQESPEALDWRVTQGVGKLSVPSDDLASSAKTAFDSWLDSSPTHVQPLGANEAGGPSFVRAVRGGGEPLPPPLRARSKRHLSRRLHRVRCGLGRCPSSRREEERALLRRGAVDRRAVQPELSDEGGA